MLFFPLLSPAIQGVLWNLSSYNWELDYGAFLVFFSQKKWGSCSHSVCSPPKINKVGTCWPFLSQKIKHFKTHWTPVNFEKIGGWLEGRDPTPWLEEYLQQEVNCFIRYQKTHIQQSCSAALNYKSSAHSILDIMETNTQYGKPGILTSVPFQLCSGSFSGNSLIPVIGGKITTEMQPKAQSKTSESWNQILKHKSWDREWAANTTSNIRRTCLRLMYPVVSGCRFHLPVLQDPTTNLLGQQQTQPSHTILNSTLT